MVSCFVIEEDSLVGYLSFSMCLLLTMQMANHVQTCSTKHAPCCAVQRQPEHRERLEAVAQCLHFCDSVVNEGWAFSGLFSASGR